MQRNKAQTLGNSQAEGFAHFLQYTLSDDLYKIVFTNRDHIYFERGPVKHDMYFGSVMFFIQCISIDLFCMAYPDVQQKLKHAANAGFDAFHASYIEKNEEIHKENSYASYSKLDHLHKTLVQDKFASIKYPDDLSKYTTSYSDQAMFLIKTLETMLYGFFELSHAEEIKKYLDKLNKGFSSKFTPSLKMFEELYDIAVKKPGSTRARYLVEQENFYRSNMQERAKEFCIEPFIKANAFLSDYLLKVYLDKKIPVDGVIKEEMNDFFNRKEKIIDEGYKKFEYAHSEAKWYLKIAKAYKFADDIISIEKMTALVKEQCEKHHTSLCNNVINKSLAKHPSYDIGPELKETYLSTRPQNYAHLRYDFSSGVQEYHKCPANDALRANIENEYYQSLGVSSLSELINNNINECLNRIKNSPNNDLTINYFLTHIINLSAKTMLYATPEHQTMRFKEKYWSVFKEISNADISRHLATIELRLPAGTEPVAALAMIKNKYVSLVNIHHPDNKTVFKHKARQYIIDITRSYASLLEHFTACVVNKTLRAHPSQTSAETTKTIDQELVVSNPLLQATNKAEMEAAALLMLMDTEETIPPPLASQSLFANTADTSTGNAMTIDEQVKRETHAKR